MTSENLLTPTQRADRRLVHAWKRLARHVPTRAPARTFLAANRVSLSALGIFIALLSFLPWGPSRIAGGPPLHWLELGILVVACWVVALVASHFFARQQLFSPGLEELDELLRANAHDRVLQHQVASWLAGGITWASADLAALCEWVTARAEHERRLAGLKAVSATIAGAGVYCPGASPST